MRLTAPSIDEAILPEYQLECFSFLAALIQFIGEAIEVFSFSIYRSRVLLQLLFLTIQYTPQSNMSTKVQVLRNTQIAQSIKFTHTCNGSIVIRRLYTCITSHSSDKRVTVATWQGTVHSVVNRVISDNKDLRFQTFMRVEC